MQTSKQTKRIVTFSGDHSFFDSPSASMRRERFALSGLVIELRRFRDIMRREGATNRHSYLMDAFAGYIGP